MGVYRIFKWGVRNFMVWIFMVNNLSLRGVWGPPPRKCRNMKCSRSDSRHILVLLRVTLCSEPNIFLYNWLKHYIFHSEVGGGSGPPWPPPPLGSATVLCNTQNKRLVVHQRPCTTFNVMISDESSSLLLICWIRHDMILIGSVRFAVKS